MENFQSNDTALAENTISTIKSESEPISAPSNEVAEPITNIISDSAITGTLASQTVPQIITYNLSGVKLEKLGIFMPYFGERTEEFVAKCTGRGENSWKKVAQRIHDLDTANEETALYVARMYEEFELDFAYSSVDIIKNVGIIRRELKMPIGEQTTKWYIQQASDLFLIEKVLDNAVSYPKVTGYKFLFKLKP